MSHVQARNLIAAAQNAQERGLCFNRHWTVHYEKAGIAEAGGARFVGHLLRLAKAQARRDSGDMAAIWVRENGPSKGGHVHILMHLPAATYLRNRTRRWIVAAGGAFRARVSKVVSLAGRLDSVNYGGDPFGREHYRANADAVLAYLLKYTEVSAGEALGLVRYGEAGLVIGKRAGFTQNLGKTAGKGALP